MSEIQEQVEKKLALEELNPKEYIIIKGARVNNLKNLSVAIPRNKLVVVTGLSGSGKSSLAFDTLFAEKDIIEREFGSPFEWMRLDNKRASRIAKNIYKACFIYFHIYTFCCKANIA